MTETVRNRTRLEHDDPEYCKRCGQKIPNKNGYTDEHGRPMVFVGLEWVSLELCHECWTDDELTDIELECTERYGVSDGRLG